MGAVSWAVLAVEAFFRIVRGEMMYPVNLLSWALLATSIVVGGGSDSQNLGEIEGTK